MLPWWVKPLAGLAIFAGAAYGVHMYNESVREPLQQTIDALHEAKADGEKRAVSMLAERDTQNKKAIEGYVDYARKSDDEHEKEKARIRAAINAANGLRFSDPFGSRCATGQAGKSDSGTPETAAPSGQLSGQLTAFLLAEAARADEVAAYAQSCYRFVNGL